MPCFCVSSVERTLTWPRDEAAWQELSKLDGCYCLKTDLKGEEATKELVKLGLGVCILAPWIAKREIEEGSLVALPLGRKKLSRRWGILQWSGRRLSLAEETFIGLCRSACGLLGQP